MNQKYTYLLVNFFCIVLPFVFSFHPKIRFYKKFPQFFAANILTGVVFVTWDAVFTLAGVWEFNPDCITGLYLFHLPVEEILFFICIPFACVFTYHCIKETYRLKERPVFAKTLLMFLCLFLVVVAFFNLQKLYTSITFFSLSFLILLLLYRRATYLYSFIVMYSLILVPFFLSNGLLTGMFTEAPVVIYNNGENLGIRMITIPVEDLFYGMLLLLMNVSLFEFFTELVSRLKNGTQEEEMSN